LPASSEITPLEEKGRNRHFSRDLGRAPLTQKSDRISLHLNKTELVAYQRGGRVRFGGFAGARIVVSSKRIPSPFLSVCYSYSESPGPAGAALLCDLFLGDGRAGESRD
jgi:hypothetical protein